MSKSIQVGIDKLVKKIDDTAAQTQLYTKAWRDIKNKIDSMLIASPCDSKGHHVIKGDVVRQKCQVLDTMNYDQRYKHILSNWGSLYAEKTKPLLLQLSTIENQIGQINPVNKK